MAYSNLFKTMMKNILNKHKPETTCSDLLIIMDALSEKDFNALVVSSVEKAILEENVHKQTTHIRSAWDEYMSELAAIDLLADAVEE